MKLLFWKKDQVVTDEAYAPYEEIDAKRTSKLGYLLLILMVIFGVWQGNNLLSSIQDSITRPQPNTSCTETLASYANIKGDIYYDNYYYSYEDLSCQFTEREISLGLDVAYQKALPSLGQLKILQDKINSLENSLYAAKYQREKNLDEYQTALVEDVAGNTDIYGNVLDTSHLGNSVSAGAQRINQIERDIQIAQAEKAKLTALITQIAQTQTISIQKAYDKYKTEINIYKLIVFLVSVILILPLFFLSWRKYHNSRLARSEYAIIWGGVVATFGLMVAQVLLVFIYEILPHQLLKFLFDFLSGFAILWTLLYWLAFILVPAFFGFLVYLLQKKFYNKQAVAMRAMKNGHCPHCSLKILPTMNNCPVCGYNLKTKCESCHNMSTSGGSFCEICGAKRNQSNTSQ